MVVHFIASKSNIKNEYPFYKAIAQCVYELGHTLARDWLQEEYEFALTGREHTAEDWRRLNRQNMVALSRADVVIAESSTKSFSTGFQVASAIQQKKQVLILTRNNELEGAFGPDVNSDFEKFAKIRNYTPETLDSIVRTFLQENYIDTKDLRFNFFIDRQIYNYLRWAAYKTGKNKSEILRELVVREIEKEG